LRHLVCAGSVPQHKNALGFEVLLGLDDVLGVVFSVVLDLGPHVVHHEWLREVELVVRVRHRLEVHGHGRTRLNVADLEVAHGGVHVRVEELGDVGAVLGEVWVVQTGLPLLVVVDHVVSAWREEARHLLVLEKSIQEPNLVQSWLGTLISDAGVKSDGASDEVNFPEEGLGEHHETHASPGEEESRPGVVAAVETVTNLVDVVRSTQAPLKVVIAENVVRVLELSWVAVGLDGLVVWSVDDLRSLVVKVVIALRGLVSQVVELWVRVLTETTHLGASQHSQCL